MSASRWPRRAEDKLRAKHASILIREGSAARNFDALAPLLKSAPESCMFCCDDLHPDLLVPGATSTSISGGDWRCKERTGSTCSPALRSTPCTITGWMSGCSSRAIRRTSSRWMAGPASGSGAPTSAAGLVAAGGRSLPAPPALPDGQCRPSASSATGVGLSTMVAAGRSMSSRRATDNWSQAGNAYGPGCRATWR